MRQTSWFKRWTAIVTAFFLLSAQPLWANPLMGEEFGDDDDNGGFVSAEQAKQLHAIQQNEVDTMDEIFNEPTSNNEDQQSVFNKFQDNDETVEENLADPEDDSTDSASDLALLSNEPTPLPEIEPVQTDSEEEEGGAETAQETTDSEESDQPQAVASAETNEPQGFSSDETEEAIQSVALQLVAAETDSGASSQSSPESPDSNLTVENLLSDEPVLLAGLSVVAVPEAPQPVLDEAVVEEVAAQAVSQSQSAVATELATLMGMNSVGASVSSGQTPGIAESSLMGGLPQASSAPVGLQEDPPAILFPGGAIDSSISIFDAGDDGTGGVSRVGSVFDAFKQFFQDLNTGNGQAIGNGLNDSLETFSEFTDLLAFIYSTFFGIQVSSGELRDLFLNGTSNQGVQLFGSENVFLNALIISAFFLQTSSFFPQNGREGVDLDAFRGNNPDAFTFNIPFVFPDYLLTALGHAISNSTITDEQANTLGMAGLNEMFSDLFTITLSLQPGNGFFIVDPNNLSNAQAFMNKNPLDFDENVDRLIEVNFISADQAEFDPTLQALMRNQAGKETGLAGFFRVTIDKETLNFIGDLMVNAFLANLGPAIDFLDSLGFSSAAGPNTPFIFTPGLFTIRGGVNQEFQGAKSGLALAVLQVLFGTGFSFLTLFGMQPPIPDISTLGIFEGSDKFSETEKNAQASFEEIKKRKAEAAKQLKSGQTKDKKKSTDDDKKKKKKGKDKSANRGAAAAGKK